jgi:hypothetical protein
VQSWNAFEKNLLLHLLGTAIGNFCLMLKKKSVRTVYILTLWKSPYMTHQFVPKVKLLDRFYWTCAIMNFSRTFEIACGIQGGALLQSFIMNQYG